MKWSPQQDAALVAFDKWFSGGGEGFWYMGGYAGTGKTTLARHLAQSVGGQVLFSAYTGKAAHVLQMKGCPEATTIHRLIYLPIEKSRRLLQRLEDELAEAEEGSEKAKELLKRIAHERRLLAQPAFTLNEDSPIKHASLIVVDECSMVDGKIGSDLLSFGTPVLVLGDPAQLPPVGGGGFFTSGEPDFMLTEIHRQAADNPIIRLATDVRNEVELKLGDYGTSSVRRPGADPQEIREYDQVIVGKNVTRYNFNRWYRRAVLSLDTPYPQTDERLVCLRNNHDKGLLNGAIWQMAEDSFVEDDMLVLPITSPDEDDPSVTVVEANKVVFDANNEEPLYQMAWTERKLAEDFNYGYALTCHKAQGSQWESVVVKDEKQVFRDNKWKWLYTAITRASDRVMVVRD